MTPVKRKRYRMYEPSSAEIRAACERFQSQWSERERLKRADLPAKGTWRPPLVKLETSSAVTEEQEN
mgnify:CR=1 FL=1